MTLLTRYRWQITSSRSRGDGEEGERDDYTWRLLSLLFFATASPPFFRKSRIFSSESDEMTLFFLISIRFAIFASSSSLLLPHRLNRVNQQQRPIMTIEMVSLPSFPTRGNCRLEHDRRWKKDLTNFLRLYLH